MKIADELNYIHEGKENIARIHKAVGDKERLKGKVMWWSERDGNGIVVLDDGGHEVYIDDSVLQDKKKPPTDDSIVSLVINKKIPNTLAGRDVKVEKK